MTADEAYISGEPIGLSLSKMLAVSFLLGLCIPGGILFVMERLRKKIVSVKEVKTLVKAPILAEVVGDNDRNAMESLCANVRCMLGADDGKVVLVTSADGADGKDYVASNLAKNMAGTGIKTLLLELDFRNPGLSAEFSKTVGKGLVQYLTENLDLNSVISHSQAGLDVIVAGAVPPNPSALLASNKLKDFFATVAKHYDCVVVDGSSVLNNPELLYLSPLVSATVCVCGIGATEVDSLPRLSHMIEDGRLVNCGLVITDFQ